MAAFDLQDFMQDFGGIQHKLLAEAEKTAVVEVLKFPRAQII